MEVYVAVSEKDRIVRAVISVGKAQCVGLGETAHAGGRTENVVAEGMSAEYQILKLVVDEFGGRVVVALYLVSDDLHLLVYLALWIDRVEHDVGEQVYRPVGMFVQHGGIEHGVFLVGEGVEVASHALHTVEYVP